MKKLLLTLIVSISFCGMLFAQNQKDGVDGNYETNWPDFNYGDYEDQGALTAFIVIDGERLSANDDWQAYEVAFFVGNECRGHDFLETPEEGFMDFPYLNATAVFYTDKDELVTFQLYNHVTGVLYTECTTNIQILTGEEHWEIYDCMEEYEFGSDEMWDCGVNLYFTTPSMPSLTKEIAPFTESGGYYLLAVPFEGVDPADVEGMTTGEFDLYGFDQTADLEWRNYKVDNFELAPGTGYLYANAENVVLTFTGVPTEVVEYQLVRNEEANLPGWNLVGNPLMDQASIDRAYYRMNEAGDEIIAAEEGEPIEVLEGIFVLTDDDGEMLTFNAYNPTGGKSAIATLNLTNARGTIDRAIVRFDEGRQLPKFQIRNSTKLSLVQDNSEYAVVRSEGMGEMPVNFKAVNNGTYTINFTNENVDFGYLHLIDNMTGANIDLLANPSYSFEATTSDYTSRFRLVFATGDAATGSDFAFVSDGNIIVNGEGTLQVIDVTGRVLSTEQINGVSAINVNAAAGVYMLQLTNGTDVKTQKVIVK